MKTFVWGGMFFGSGVGSAIPMLWGGGMLSMSSIFLSALGAILGIWGGYVLGKNFGA